MPGSLYLIAGPIGNLGDITVRGKQWLAELNCFFCEDTRELKKLFAGLGMDASGKEMFSYAAHNLKSATDRAIEKLLSGTSVGFLSDRGTPGISDPGSLLCALALQNGVTVVPVPGPSAVVSLLSVSGLNSDRFTFLGFLPRKESEKEVIWKQVEKNNWTFCFYESPERAQGTLEELVARFPLSEIVIGRELTKSHESVIRFSAKQGLPEFPARGEFVIAVAPNIETRLSASEQELGLENKIAERLASEREWAKIVAKQVGVAVSDVYNALQKAKQIEP